MNMDGMSGMMGWMMGGGAVVGILVVVLLVVGIAAGALQISRPDHLIQLSSRSLGLLLLFAANSVAALCDNGNLNHPTFDDPGNMFSRTDLYAILMPLG